MNPTRQQIVHIAEELFSRQRYDQVSVAQICRQVGIANSVYYYYFQNKEALFREILDGLFNSLDDAFGLIQGHTPDERLNSMLDIHLRMAENCSRELAIYREGEFRFPEYDHALRAIYHSSLELVFNRPVSLGEYYYVYGGLRFLTRRLGAVLLRSQRRSLIGIIRKGIFKEPLQFLPDNFPASVDLSACDHSLPRLSIEEAILPTDEPGVSSREESGPMCGEFSGGDSRQRMILAGMELIGNRGYHNTQVSDITRRAGCSVGLFYKKFCNKEEFLELILEHLNHSIRSCLKTLELSHGNRCDVEIHGIHLFLEFFQRRPYLFNLLQEAEFISPDGMKRFYDRLEAGYVVGLEGETSADVLLSANFLIGIANYLGGEVLFADDPPLPSKILPEFGRLLWQGMEINRSAVEQSCQHWHSPVL